MPSTVWNKYEKINQIYENSNIKTYLSRIELNIKEIIPENIDEYELIREKIEFFQNKIKIYDIIEEEDRLYIVIENDKEISTQIDNLILSKESDIQKEGILLDQGSPVSKNEILNVLNKEKAMCKIITEKIIDNKPIEENGTGFFCKFENFPLKYALFTNNHILDENDIKLGKLINFEYNKEPTFFDKSTIAKKKIKISENRRVYTNKKLDYTCIELFESDGFKNFFEIDPILFNDNINLKDSDIFILHYPQGKVLCFSYGKVKSNIKSKIIHSASTKKGSSGSPIIRRSENIYLIGLHFGYKKNKHKFELSFNLGTRFDFILNDINKNEINCTYIVKDNEKEIKLLYDYSSDLNTSNDDLNKLYLEAKKINKKFYQENLEIYVNGEKINSIINLKLIMIIKNYKSKLDSKKI